MNFSMRIWLYGLLSILLLIGGGCSRQTVGLTDNGKTIQLIKNPEQFPQECIFLGDVKTMEVKGSSSSYQNALNKIRNHVAEMEGTHIKLVNSITDDMSTLIHGEAYRCSGKPKSRDAGSSANQDSWIIID